MERGPRTFDRSVMRDVEKTLTDMVIAYANDRKIFEATEVDALRKFLSWNFSDNLIWITGELDKPSVYLKKPEEAPEEEEEDTDGPG